MGVGARQCVNGIPSHTSAHLDSGGETPPEMPEYEEQGSEVTLRWREVKYKLK